MRSLASHTLLILALAVSGCAAMQRDTRARALAGDYVYERPLTEVLPHVRALLVAQGYTPHDISATQLETDWREEVAGSENSAARSKYTVVYKDAGNRCVVRFLKATQAVEAHQGGVVSQTEGGREGTKDSGGGSKSVERAQTNIDLELTGTLKRASDDRDPTAEASLAEEARGTQAKRLAGARDLNMEWLLLQRVEPEAAAKIYAQAEKP